MQGFRRFRVLPGRPLHFRIFITTTSGVNRPRRIEAMLDDLRSRGLRITPQRDRHRASAFADDPTHPTAQELFERLRPAFPVDELRDGLQHARRARAAGPVEHAAPRRTARRASTRTRRRTTTPSAIAAAPCVDVPAKDARARRRRRVRERAAPRRRASRSPASSKIYRGLCARCAARAKPDSTRNQNKEN